MEVAAREVAATAVRLAIAERDGHFDEELDAVRPIVDDIGEEARESGVGRSRRPAARDARGRGGQPPGPAPRDRRGTARLLWPPADRLARLAGCAGTAPPPSRRSTSSPGGAARPRCRWVGDARWLHWQATVGFPCVGHAGDEWAWRYEGLASVGGEDVLDGRALARLADLLGELAGTGPALLHPGTWRFDYELPDGERGAEPFRPLTSSATAALAGAAQLVRLGGVAPAKPATWSALVDGLVEVVRRADPGRAELAYPPELAALDGTELGSTGLQVVFPRAASEIVMGHVDGQLHRRLRRRGQVGRLGVLPGHLGPDVDRPVHNLELLPGVPTYLVGELKARFNADCPPAITAAVELLVDGLLLPTRPWPPKPPPHDRARRPSSGRGRGPQVNRARRADDARRLDAACAAALVDLDLSPLLALEPAAKGAAAAATTSPGSTGRRSGSRSSPRVRPGPACSTSPPPTGASARARPTSSPPPPATAAGPSPPRSRCSPSRGRARRSGARSGRWPPPATRRCAPLFDDPAAPVPLLAATLLRSAAGRAPATSPSRSTSAARSRPGRTPTSSTPTARGAGVAHRRRGARPGPPAPRRPRARTAPRGARRPALVGRRRVGLLGRPRRARPGRRVRS